MLHEFFEVAGNNGKRDRIYVQTAVQISGVEFDIVDLKTEFTDGCDEVRKRCFAFKFQMNFKMVRPAFEAVFHFH